MEVKEIFAVGILTHDLRDTGVMLYFSGLYMKICFTSILYLQFTHDLYHLHFMTFSSYNGYKLTCTWPASSEAS